MRYTPPSAIHAGPLRNQIETTDARLADLEHGLPGAPNISPAAGKVVFSLRPSTAPTRRALPTIWSSHIYPDFESGASAIRLTLG
jgi:hypothetical protein